MFRDRRFVPGKPEARPTRCDCTLNNLHRLSEDRASQIEIFQPMGCRCNCKNMRACFGEQVTGHWYCGGFSLASDAEPAGHAADLHQVRHDEVARTRSDRFGKAAWEPPIFAGLDRYWRGGAHFGMAQKVFG